MVPVGVNFPVAGLYSSAVPPAISTWPSFSRVAGWPSRGLVMLPVRDQVPVADVPPATSTWPSGSSVAVESVRGVFIWPVTAQVPVAGL